MKRFLFILLSLVLASANFFLYFVQADLRNVALLVVTVFFIVVSAIFIKLTLKKVPVHNFLILPTALVLGFSSLTLFFPNLNLPFRIGLWLLGSLAFYVNFLCLNVFAVSLETEVKLPLLRAAVTVSSLVVSVALFFIFTAVYKIEAIFAIQGALIFLSTYLLNRFYFWAASLESHLGNYEREVFLSGLVAFEVATATAFLPLEAFFRGFLLISIVYVVNGLLLARLKHALNRRVVTEYATVLGLVILLLMAFNF